MIEKFAIFVGAGMLALLTFIQIILSVVWGIFKISILVIALILIWDLVTGFDGNIKDSLVSIFEYLGF